MLSIVIASRRTGDPLDTHLWDDLRITLTSIDAYAPQCEVVVAWDGPSAPDRLPDNPLWRILERPSGLNAARAFRWAMDQASHDLVLVTSDDVCFLPDSVSLLLEDWDYLHDEAGHQVGLLAPRSNLVAGLQNVRIPNGGELQGFRFTSEARILPAAQVFPFVTLASREVLTPFADAVADLHWYGDNLLCFDLANAGYRHFVSRSYIHHVGFRGTASDAGRSMADENAAGLAWLREHRPDYYQVLVAAGNAPAT